MARATVGLALGSGGAKGFAHIGVLRALEEHGVQIDVVTGTSMGSLIGAFYVTGMKPAFMERLASTLTWRHWLDVTVPKMGLVAGEKIHQMVTMLTRGLTFEALGKPFACVATDLVSRSSVTLQSGRISDAVRASISIPGVFVPYVMNDQVFVDGGVLERVPVQAARTLGADVVIGVDVSSVQRTSVPETMLDVIMQSLDLMQMHSVEDPDKRPDVCLEPDLSDLGTSQFHRAVEAVQAGYQAAIDAMPNVLALTREAGEVS